MPDIDVNSIVKKYIELRDARETESKAHVEDMQKKYGEPMEVIERWLMEFMNKNGIDNIKTPSGTPYKAVSKSVKMSDPETFKTFVFTPLIDLVTNAIQSAGGHVPDLTELLRHAAFWDMIDFRCGKKGIEEYVAENGQIPPGVTLDSFTKINIRRS